MQSHDLIKGRNFFGHFIYSPFAVLIDDANSPLRRFLEQRMAVTLKSFGCSFDDIVAPAKAILSPHLYGLRKTAALGARRRYMLHELENAFRDELRTLLFPNSGPNELSGATDPRVDSLRDRSTKIAKQVVTALEDENGLDSNPPLFPKSPVALLDVGCGDGVVAMSVGRTIESKLGGQTADPIALVDIADYRETQVREAKVPFALIPPDYEQFGLHQRAPKQFADGRQFDLILLLTVLHHSELPSRTFRACAEVASEQAAIVVIESCIGINREGLGADAETDGSGDFAALGNDEQLRYAAFVDWFYNRVIQRSDDVYVPCNFGSPAEWNAFFGEFGGFKVCSTQHLGFDQPLVPEYHTIHLVRRNVEGAHPLGEADQ